MRIGYPCINLSLSCRSSRTFRLASYSEERMRSTVKGNLACLMETLEFNLENKLLFFRITSDLIPFASHPVCKFPWEKEFKREFSRIGDFIKKYNMRVCMHPDQFTLINSVKERVFISSKKELEYHAGVMELLGVDDTAKIQIHIGGAYGDKKSSMDRFIRRYNTLNDRIKRRLVIENDDRLFDVDDCMSVSGDTGIPVVFDVLHFRCSKKRKGLRESLLSAFSTWGKTDGAPIVDYSSQQKGRKRGSHASAIDTGDFKRFIRQTNGFDPDIMLEIKDKEKSALKAVEVLGLAPKRGS